MECAPISEDHPLHKMSHFVAGSKIPVCEAAVAEKAPRFAAFYAALGVATMPTICDGDCAVDVMHMMLGLPQTFQARKQLRIEICEYLIARISDPWMHDIMVALQELEKKDVALYRSHGTQIATAPEAAPTAVAEPIAPSETTSAPEVPAPEMQPAAELVPASAVGPAIPMSPIEAPSTPKTAALKRLKPPAPASLPDLTDGSDVNTAAVAGVPPEVQAKHQIDAALLRLAREIRQPRAYVGYSAFVLMGLLKKCQPCVWERATRIDLLETFAPWAKDEETKAALYTGIPCTIVASSGSTLECMPVSEKHPLPKVGHFVAGCLIRGPSAVAEGSCSFDAFYAALGVAPLATVADGDCAIDVMNKMLGADSNLKTRTDLRIEIADYLNERAGELWMHELMVRLGEVDEDDLKTSKSQEVQPEELDITTTTLVAVPAFPAPAQEAVDEAPSEKTIDEETFNAMQWASKLHDHSSVLSLAQALPAGIIREQVVLYRNRPDPTAVAVKTEQNQRIRLNPKSRYTLKMTVAARFHIFCQSRGIVFEERFPYGIINKIIDDNVIWDDGKSKNKQLSSRTLRDWYTSWRDKSGSDLIAGAGQQMKIIKEQSFLKSRATVKSHMRLRALGAGAKYKAPLVRGGLYEWWSGIRYAIDWKKLVETRRSRGKKHLARFPRSVLRVKVNQLQADLAAACILHGLPVVTINPDSWWFKRWEDEFGLSMRQANRKYAVPRYVQKERMEIFWINLFRVRLFILQAFGYDPWMLNWDQAPFHHNESGAQNKPVLGVLGGLCPVVEGNSDIKSRWTAQLMTSSRFPAVAGSSSSN